jgi:hypothetical protein
MNGPRLKKVLLAYLAALLTAGLLLRFGLAFLTDRPALGPELILAVTGTLTVVSFVAVFIAELIALRHFAFYCGAGALIGAAIGFVFRIAPELPWLGACIGCVAGWIYWRIAGRTAGLA